jgi:hypothetical protein
MDTAPSFFRRKQAGQYLKSKYGFCSEKGLGGFATLGGGPPFRKIGSSPKSPVVYEVGALDAWALAQMSEPLSSTSDYPHDARKCSPGRPRKIRGA